MTLLRINLFIIGGIFMISLNHCHGQNVQDSLHFNSLFGTTGNILTSDAYTVGKFKGNIGVFENFSTDFNDNLIFNFGVHEKIEVGLQSEIPTGLKPELNFFFKIRANDQGEYFRLKSKFIPVTSFGINRDNAFAVASYKIRSFGFSAGYNFSDNKQSVFGSMTIQPFAYGKIQLEYVKDFVSIGLRTRYKGITNGLIYAHNLDDNNFNDESAFWEISFNF